MSAATLHVEGEALDLRDTERIERHLRHGLRGYAEEYERLMSSVPEAAWGSDS